MQEPLALVVDSDPASRAQVEDLLHRAGVRTFGAASWPEAVESSRNRPLRILILDAHAPGVSLSGALREAERAWPAAARILIGVEDRAAESVALLRGGLQEVLAKPLDADALRVAAERALAYSEVASEVCQLRQRLREREGYERIVGRSPAMQRLRDRLEHLAARDDSVLFTGEDGVGKELAARTLHASSERADGPFVVLDCSSDRNGILERQLLGAPASATTPGDGGSLASADGGILFLDEVAALPAGIQERFSRILASGTLAHGERRGHPFDVRVVSAFSDDVARVVDEGRFLEELQGQLSGSAVHIEPLRDRPDDIPVLASHFVRTICEVNDLDPIELTGDTLSALEDYGWPGNARELRGAMEHASILAGDGIIRPRDLPDRVREAHEVRNGAGSIGTDAIFREAKRAVVEEFERRYLEELLEKNRGNVTAAAQQAGMLRSALQRLLRKHSLRSADYRRPRREARQLEKS